MRVLSVDDNAENRSLVEAILKGNGIEVESAVNGAEAFDRLQNGGFDLIISDILMPVMDGYKLCQKVKADERLRHIPFIVYTSTFTSAEDEALARKIGAERFIQKPCDLATFMAIVREVTAKATDGSIAASPLPSRNEEVLQLYSERLVQKLEKKMLELEQEIETRQQAERSRQELESQLHQAQKMESIGRLAGGVAHDYNNMLSVILGYAQMALERTEPGSLMHNDLREILDAAERSVVITRQLLAFARKQTVAPLVINLNETVEDMLNMLRRLIGEDINLIWRPGPNLQPVKIDPSQVDQILANLCVNARDAIAGVGRITIETAMATFDEEYCTRHAGAVPGEQVLLAVGDDGCGMERELLDKIFEPFFTTKAVGKGTGLGLATVYGIVKQNNGLIDVSSEPGHGTTFKVYLPRCHEL
ncbi:MAG: PAS/PAC sensor hybrid histidine kinase [uncultured bacterium]|nr:MAG: PAS/PAC sensor hybrid histidine kinase [uncultured bacterium]